MKSDDIFKLIVGNIRNLFPFAENEPIDHTTKLCLIGLGSVERAELIEQTLEDLSLKTDRFEFHSANNLGELSELFSLKLNEAI